MKQGTERCSSPFDPPSCRELPWAHGAAEPVVCACAWQQECASSYRATWKASSTIRVSTQAAFSFLSRFWVCACVLSHFSCVQLSLCDPMDCSPPGSSVHGILQARLLEWVAMPSSRGSSRLRFGVAVDRNSEVPAVHYFLWSPVPACSLSAAQMGFCVLIHLMLTTVPHESLSTVSLFPSDTRPQNSDYSLHHIHVTVIQIFSSNLLLLYQLVRVIVMFRIILYKKKLFTLSHFPICSFLPLTCQFSFLSYI